MRLAAPLIVSQLAAIGESLLIIMLAGHLGANVLGAVAVGANVMALAILTVIGVMMAISPSVAQLDGAGRRTEIGPLFRQALFLAIAIGIVLQGCMYVGGPLMARAMGVDATLLDDADAYLHAGSFAVLPLALYIACRGLSEGLSIMRPGMYFSIAGLFLLVPAGYLLMYPLGLGAAGAGLAIAVMMWVQFLAFALFLCLDRRYRGLGWERGARGPNLAAILPLLRIGVPMGASVLMEAALFTIASLAIGRFGAVAVSSHQIALSVASVTFMVPLGLAMATTVRVGNAVGRGDPDGVRTAGHAGMALALGAQAVAALLMLGLPRQIAGLYADDPQIVAGAASLLFLAALFQLSDGLQVTCNGALRGLKDARFPMLITGFSYWIVGMPIGWFFAFAQGWQTPGMWLGLVAGLSTAAVLLFLRFQSLSRRAVPVEKFFFEKKNQKTFIH